MPHIIEHPIRVIGLPSSPPLCPPPPRAHPTEFGRYDHLQRDKSWVESPFERRTDEPPPQQKRRGHFSGEEETFGVESFERNLRYSPHEVDRQHFAVRTFEEKFPLGSANDVKSGRSGVRFEDQSEQDEGTASDHKEKNHLLSYSPHLDTMPIRIPRIRSCHPADEREEELGTCARSTPISCHSSRGSSSPSPSPHCLSAFAATHLQNVPMKKVIRRSRLVSVHDGRPMGPFTETVHYEPTIIGGGYYSSADEGRGRSLSERRRTTSRDQRWHKVKIPATALWTSSSSAGSLSSNDEREETHATIKSRGGEGSGRKEGRMGGEGSGRKEGRMGGEGSGRKEGRMGGEGSGRKEGRMGGEGSAGWTKKDLVQVQHNPLFYGTGSQF